MKDTKATPLQKIKQIFTKKRRPWVLAACGVGLIFLCITSFGVFATVSNIASRNRRISYLETTIEDLQNRLRSFQSEEEEEQQEQETDDTETETSDDSELKGDFALEIDFLSTPQLVSGMSLFEEIQPYSSTDPDADAKFYKAGTVKSGGFENYSPTDCAGFEYFVAVYEEREMIDDYYPTYVRFIRDPESKWIYLVNRSSIMAIPFFEGYVKDVSEQVDTSYFNDLKKYYKDYSHSEHAKYYHVIQSDKGYLYEFNHFQGTPFSSMSLRKVDSFKGRDMYFSNNNDLGASYMRSKDGFLDVLKYVPKIIENSDYIYDPIPEITWNAGGSNSSEYDYISVGSCFENYLEIENVNPSSLEVVGKGQDGSNVYEVKDKNDLFRREVYVDYSEGDMRKYNDISEDDSSPLSYEGFLSHHPVFYWKDPFGRYIKFANRDFVLTGGCAKPVIYLYPQEEMDISVYVKPNGALTFSAPKYNSGWDVTAYPSGKLINKVDSEKYDYLWWESRSDGFSVPHEGFVVRKENIANLLDEKLALFGLNQKEIGDFKDYWLDEMYKEDKHYFFITFLFDEQVNQIAKLEFSKRADVEMRIFMVYQPLAYKKQVNEITIPHHDREGFVVVEWGGARISE